MQFQIPQFIEVEDKIFGPLTFRQFIYLAGGAGCCYLLYRILPFILAFPLIGVVMGLAAALAFFQYNGRPFIIAVEHAFYFFLIPSSIFGTTSVNEKPYRQNNRKRRGSTAKVMFPKLSGSKLHELSWALDIKERIATGGDVSKEERQRSTDVLAPVQTMRSALHDDQRMQLHDTMRTIS
jgi:hypothetical protein